MRTSKGFRHMASVSAILTVLAVPYSSRAEEVLGPMAGTGGVMRDAERRALAPTEAAVPKSNPAISGAKKPEVADAKKTGKVLGPIEAVKINGSKEFAERERLAERILAELGAGGDKTLDDVKAAN